MVISTPSRIDAARMQYAQIGFIERAPDDDVTKYFAPLLYPKDDRVRIAVLVELSHEYDVVISTKRLVRKQDGCCRVFRVQLIYNDGGGRYITLFIIIILLLLNPCATK